MLAGTRSPGRRPPTPAIRTRPPRPKTIRPTTPTPTKADTLRTTQAADHVSKNSTRTSIDIARVSGHSHKARYLKHSPAWVTALSDHEKSDIACPKTPSRCLATTL